MPRAFVQGGIRIALILVGVAALMYAFLARGEGGDTFATNGGTGTPGLELKINAKTYYNGVLQPQLTWNLKNLVPGVDKFWNFGDVKPGDTGTSSISIHIKKNPAYVCLDFVNLTDTENGINEPESHLDLSTSTGELAEGLEFFAWRDDGDRKFEVGEKPLFGTTTQSAVQVLSSTTYPLADSAHGTPFADGSTNYVGIYWCAGDLSVNLGTATASCNGAALGNEAQTDSMSVDVKIRAVQSKYNSKFLCTPPPVKYGQVKIWKHVVGETNPDLTKYEFLVDGMGPYTIPPGERWVYVTVPVGPHTVTEIPEPGYVTTYAETYFGDYTTPDGDCNDIYVWEGYFTSCRVTNTKVTTPPPPPANNGQCPSGYTKQVDNYAGGLSWKSDGAYASVILVGGPSGSTNKDPDGRNKYFSNVLKNQTISRAFHDISHICVKPHSVVQGDSWHKVEKKNAGAWVRGVWKKFRS